MDWIEWPARALGWVDLQLAALIGPLSRLVVWSAAAGTLTMLLYAGLSPQRRIAAARRELAQARRQLDAFDGELSKALPLMGGMLRCAFRQLGLVAAPAIAALLPMVVLAAWIAQVYGYAFPAQLQAVEVRAAPERMQAQWLPSQVEDDGQTRPPRVALHDETGRALGEIEMPVPVPLLSKRSWRAAMAASPLGFLPDEWPVERVEIDLPRREYLAWGPAWMRSWEFLFFSVLTVVALGLKRALRLQ